MSESQSIKEYIVGYSDSLSSEGLKTLKEEIAKIGGVITTEFEIIKGFVVKLPAFHIDSVGKLPGVVNVEPNGEVHTM